ncbi:MAG: phage holin family protein [Leptospiraceae bacterium]|nr:phage holin family protein [Leptospiraceae bacterium]MCK6381570.1 phage holin family protein [Leptospiraceae bacterium]
MKQFFISITLQILTVIFLFPLIDSHFQVRGGIQSAIIVVLIFISLNFAIRKLTLIFTLGLSALLYYLSLGIAGLILNALILILIAKLFPNYLEVPSFFSAFVGGAALTFANYLGKRKD